MILFNTRINLLKYSFNYLKACNSSRILFNSKLAELNRSNQYISTSSSLLFGTRNKSTHYSNENFTKTVKIAALLLSGSLAYLLYNAFDAKDTTSEISLDLNHIYESCAVMFLSNPELIEALGLPIKITSSESDLVREIHLRRQGNDLFSFISYRLQGSQNSGTVYCKLRMFNDSHKFQAEDILLKLDKKHNNKREIVIKTNRVPKKNEND